MEQVSSSTPNFTPFIVGYAAWILWAAFWWRVHATMLILIGVPIGFFLGAFVADAYHRRFSAK